MRLLCSAGIVLLATAGGLSPRAAATENSPHTYFDCGRDIIRTEFVSDLPAGLKPHANRGAGGPQTFSIILNSGPGLVAAPEALAAFQRAARIWESFFHDPITVIIDAEYFPLGPNILGFASSRQFNTDYTTIRDAMVADAQSGEAILASLPTLSDYDVILPEGFAFADELRASKALLRALGFDMSFDDGNPDAVIGFSSEFSFDFDPTDGISPFSFDFEGVALQEIGHALGFISGVDSVDRQLRADCQRTFGDPNNNV
ncbi:MAG: NF038122 family metalloprotease, partial [Planctomycetes bacterium]|nr:NF038122 family metalloprotease [Planctomycetota bacterium]